MAVIFAVVGGGALVGIVRAVTYDDHSDHSDYSDADYCDYSDAAERRKRRMEETQKEIDLLADEVNVYKETDVNGYLQSNSLKQESGVTVSVPEVKEDGYAKINADINSDIGREGSQLQRELGMIDDVINRIDKIMKNN